jgi:hypothetical protein
MRYLNLVGRLTPTSSTHQGKIRSSSARPGSESVALGPRIGSFFSDINRTTVYCLSDEIINY